MHVDPALLTFAGDPSAQATAQDRVLAASAKWRRRADVAQVLADCEALDDGADFADCESLSGLLRGTNAQAFVQGWLAAMAEAMRADPLAQLPFRHSDTKGTGAIHLHRAGRATLALLLIEKRAAAQPASVVFSDSERHEIVLAGRAQALSLHDVPGSPPEGSAGELLPGSVFHGDARHSRAFVSVDAPLALLRVVRDHAEPTPTREVEIASGRVVHRASSSAADGRAELAAALLGAMGRSDAAPVLGRYACGKGGEGARWQALRNALALDTGDGFEALCQLANRPDDPLGGDAAQLLHRLCTSYPTACQHPERAMPRELKPDNPGALSLDECLARIDAMGFDPQDESSLINAARALAGLAANRTFLGDLLIDQLAGTMPEAATAYGPQAIMLAPPRNGYFIRANIWPAPGDPAYQASGAASFVYGMPHDHNFDFLTVGYFGPGYVSDYWEYNYASMRGEEGEAVDLRFVERSALGEGRVLHYRAHRDVHCQHPPESLSVSLNICAANPAQGWFDQYRFDTDAGRIAGVLNPSANAVMLRLGAAVGSEDARRLAREFASAHPSVAMRREASELLRT